MLLKNTCFNIYINDINIPITHSLNKNMKTTNFIKIKNINRKKI